MEATNVIHRVPVNLIYRNSKQPRKTFKQESLEELADSIREHGVIQPVIVEYALREQGTYMLVAGERRWRAAILAGQKTIPAIIQEASNHNGRERLIIGVVENVQREDINPIEEAEAYQELIDKYKMTPQEVAQKIGKKVSWIYICLQRLQLQSKVVQLMRSGALSTDRRAVTALLSIQDPAAQVGIAERAVQSKMTIPTIVNYVSRMNTALESKKIKKIHTVKSPAMSLARERSRGDFDDESQPPQWDALQQLGKVPPWDLVVSAANRTCDGCELHSMANQSVCGKCPAVDMLVQLVDQTERSLI